VLEYIQSSKRVRTRFLFGKGLAKKMAKKKGKKQNKKPKSEKKTENAWSARGISAPENFVFGLVLASALFFSFLFLQSARRIPTSFSTVNYSKEKIAFEKKIRKIVKGYPIEKMSPYISRKNKRVASFLVAIAKKESNWGKHSPKKGGRECFNYWGYRGSENTTRSGYSCFDSPQHAVNVVGKRIGKLVAEKVDTPQKMVMWKCGTTSCARRDQGAAKWIWDVGVYYNKIYPAGKQEDKERKITDSHPEISFGD
jgi:hypothetical protein